MRLALATAFVSCALGAPKGTALDRYVAKRDSSFRYELKSADRGATGASIYLLDLVSQTWRKPEEVDRTEWRHWLRVVRPAEVKHRTGLLFITGGSNGVPARSLTPGLEEIAAKTHSVVAELRMVPNQPLVFPGEKPLVEDQLIAYTWDKYLQTGDELWPARLPMTKSAVRAMDAVTAFLAKEGVTLEKFVVSGASKRGWTTWTTAAVDKRVAGIVPLVIDTLNTEVSFDHHWRVYGFYSPAIQDYVERKIPDWADTPQYRALLAIEDPYSYRDRLTIPKFIINAAGDQYFLPDSWRFYWNDLKGPKQLRYLPNTDHSMRGTDVQQSILAWYDALLRGVEIPSLSWKLEGATLRIDSSARPKELKLWTATNPDKRDFRLLTTGPVWKSEPLNALSVTVPKPEKGFTAYMVEASYEVGSPYPLKLTTGVHVTPDVYSFPPRERKLRGR